MRGDMNEDHSGRSDRPGDGPSARRVLATTALVLLPILGVALLWLGQKAVFLLFAGMLLAAILDAATRGLVRGAGLSRRWAYGIVVAAVVAALAALFGLAGTALAAQAEELYATLQEQARRVGDMIDPVLPGQPDDERETLMGTLRDLGRMFGGDGTGPASMAQSAFGIFANAFVIFFIGVFLALDPGLYKDGLVRLFPVDLRARADAALHGAGETLRHWLVGKLMSMAVITVLTLVGLLAVGYPLAIPLAVLAGLLAFVPNLGPILTYIPIALAGLSAGTTTMLLGIGAYAAAQTIESYLFTPLIQKRMVSLPPALILFAQVLGGILFGLWGVALATPFAAILRLWIERYYIRRTLEGEAPQAEGTVRRG
jgi:predicted PurR-regulated permease PerM